MDNTEAKKTLDEMIKISDDLDKYPDWKEATQYAIQALKPLPTLEELERVIEPSLNEALAYLGDIGSRLNKSDRTTIKNYIATAILDLLKGEEQR